MEPTNSTGRPPRVSIYMATQNRANLLPRAKHHHDWYHARFPDYPPQRKVVFPYLY